MKRFLIVWVMSFVALMVCSQEKVTEYAMRPAVVVRMPLQGDSINQKGEKFGAVELLETHVPFDFSQAGRVSADTAGYVTVEKPQADNLLYLFSTRFRAERFMKGKLRVSSPARFEVFVNGRSRRSKTTAEDSLPQVHPVEIDLRLEPEADYEIVVKLLAAAGDKAQPVLKCDVFRCALPHGSRFETSSFFVRYQFRQPRGFGVFVARRQVSVDSIQ